MTAADTEIREVEKMFAVNVFGPMRMFRFFHRMLVESKGVVVNIGVRVVNVISGEVGTNILKSDLNRRLPVDSLYIPIEDTFVSHVRRTPGM
ncbi:MAG: hypothetical protein Q9187_000157 [Circinaria calcarea]